MKVTLSEQAAADLDDIADWLVADMGERALSFVQSLRRSCASLGDMPLRFPIVATHPSMTVRRRVHGNYLILYVVEEEAVCVLRIIHGARDYEALLFPETESSSDDSVPIPTFPLRQLAFRNYGLFTTFEMYSSIKKHSENNAVSLV